MTTYTSKSRQGFFSDETHGTPTLLVPDPAWVRPVRDIVLQPGETAYYADHAVTNNTEEPLEVTDVPDMDAEHPKVEVPNPDCRLPADAKPITEQMRVALLAAPYGINWDTEPPTAAGEPVLDPAQAWAAYQAQARAALAATGSELAGLVEFLAVGEPLPASATTLVAYRRALSAIVAASGGNPNLPLPTRS